MFWIAVLCLPVLQVLTLEPPLDDCRKTWHTMMKNSFKCCKVPTIYTDEDLKACGMDKTAMNGEETKMRPPDCSKHVCLLQRNNLMKDENTVDRAAISAFLDKFVEINEDFKDAVEIAKNKCINGELKGRPEMCEANRLGFCLVNNIFSNCPRWEDTDECAKVKEIVQKCPPP